MNKNDKVQLNSFVERIREFAIEADKGLGIHQLEEFRRLESIRKNLLKEINEFRPQA